MVDPDGTEGFQINAGVRIRGGFSRTGNNPKHAFRLFFSNKSPDNYFQHRIDRPSIVPAFGYTVIPTGELSLDLDDRGDQLWLVATNASGVPLTIEDQIAFPSSLSGVSLGPWPATGDGFF